MTITKPIEDRIQRWLVDYPVGYATDVSEHDLLREAEAELRRLRAKEIVGTLEKAECELLQDCSPTAARRALSYVRAALAKVRP